jgi:hypothetical protein
LEYIPLPIQTPKFDTKKKIALDPKAVPNVLSNDILFLKI